MEWNSKLLWWDFSDPYHDGELKVGAFDGPSFVVGSQNVGRDCSVDLKLGGLAADLCPPERWTNHPVMSAAPTAAISAVPLRRGRGGGTTAACLVDGCKSDPSNSREYHKRPKVCEAHSKTPVVSAGGQEQRFCQQCSRFHHLMEFDDVKRSCRKRLDGHNRRRRKPQPESINSGSLFSDQGSRVLTFPHLTSTPVQGHSWPGIIKIEGNPSTNHLTVYATERQQHLSSCFSSNERMKQFPFLQQDNTGFSRTTLGQSTFQPFLKITSPGKRECGSCTQVFDLDCALSLLSSATNPGLNMGQMLPASRIPMHHQSLVSTLPYCSIDRHWSSQASSYISASGFPCSGVKDEQVTTVLASEAAAGLDCQSVFNEAGQGSSDEASQALPLSWQ